MLQYGWTLKTYAQWNKPGAKGPTLYESTYMNYLQWSNSQGQKVERGWQGLEEGDNREVSFNGYRVLVGEDGKCSRDGGDAGTIIWMYLMHRKWLLKRG